ncbi:hypothetical protein TSUD_43100 [Trifolium subterraneum]|uniref:non-specific serine/threonine protein kinase n=1 Tax=Trifolium subterraneum TaxID=3900 RepID=A0A2Z6P0E6_TRISU|nr:hypothetical protein TSUD_43100 [Trifolium subterraneum]
MDLLEGVGESSSPPRSFGGYNNYDVRTDVYNRLVETGHDQAISNPDFREQIEAHFNRLPPSYGLDVNVDRAEDVLLHRSLLDLARDPDKRPVYHIRLLENISTRTDGEDQHIGSSHTSPEAETSSHATNGGGIASLKRTRDLAIEFESCSKLEDLNLDVIKNSKEAQEKIVTDSFSQRHENSSVPVHEIIFSAVDKPKLLSQLSALLSDIGLNIREAHVFSTTDGYSLDVFVVDGWPLEETDGLYAAMEKAVARSEEPAEALPKDLTLLPATKAYKGSWSHSSNSHSAVAKALAAEGKSGDWEIDRRSLKIGEKIASGSCGDLYHGVYLGEDVAVKVLKSEQLNDALEDEFTQEVAILRQVRHKNVVRFIGACTKCPHLCIITEYMTGGSLYDYLHKNRNVLELSQLLKFAIDVCKGMEYLHGNNIIHRDLKTANLLMDTHNVPYDTMTPLQAALGVRQGLRPELPKHGHPKLLDLMQRCWEAVPSSRPSFNEIRVELENLLLEVENSSETNGA